MKHIILITLLLTSVLKTQDLQNNIEKLNSTELYDRAKNENNLSGTANFIESQFKSIGLEDVETQTFEVESGLNIDNNSVSFGIIVPRRGIPIERIKPSVQTWDVEKDWLPLGFTSEGDIEDAELAFVGYGITADSYDDYAGIDVTDKVVIILTDSPEGEDSEKYKQQSSYEYKVRNAKEKGAAAALFIKAMGDSANVFEPVIVDDFNSGIVAMQANRTSLERYFPKKKPLIDQEKAIREMKQPKSFILPNVSANLSIKLEKKEIVYKNIYGMIEGEDEDKSVIIVFPYDESLSNEKIENYVKKQNKFYYPSGNNLSGIATAFELAKRFKENQPPHNVFFVATSGDEPYFDGSTNAVEQLDDWVSSSSAIMYVDNTEKIHKKHAVINSNDPLIVQTFRDNDNFSLLKVDAKELNSKDNNPFLLANQKYVRISNKLRSYPPPKREWKEKDFEDLNLYIDMLENVARNINQD
jgi:hypothetical protein